MQKKLRTIQWGANVYVAANFDVETDQSVTLPEGIWYDYLNGGTRASSSYSLAPGELKVFTGSPVQAPTFDNIEYQAIEHVMSGEGTKAYKILRNGQVLIVRGDHVYTITGARVQ